MYIFQLLLICLNYRYNIFQVSSLATSKATCAIINFLGQQTTDLKKKQFLIDNLVMASLPILCSPIAMIMKSNCTC